MQVPAQSHNNSLEFNPEFQKAYDLMERSSRHVFITGKAGTGKSTLLMYFREQTGKSVAVVAPTGVAAVNVRGQTIHSFFRFKPDITPDTVEDIRLYKAQKTLYKNLECLVIDEVSMLRADLLDCVETFLRLHGPKPGESFGGVQMILIGDLYQLPPVVSGEERNLFRGIYNSPYFFDAHAFKNLSCSVIELEKIYRQTDQGFIEILGNLRENKISAGHLETFNTRYLPDFVPNEEEMFIYLTTTNAMADQINQERLNALKTRPYIFEGDVNGAFGERNLPTQSTLELKYQAQVMLLSNDPLGRWFNGSLGRVVGVTEDEDSLGVVRVELIDGRRIEVAPMTWEMFRFFYNEESESIEAEAVGSFKQFPLRLAWAVTIHKAQGKTFDQVIIDTGRGAFAHGQMYVALSRCRSLEGIVLKQPIRQKDVIMDWRVLKFMNAFKHIQKEDKLEISVE